MSENLSKESKFGGSLKGLPDFELEAGNTAFLIIDMQYLDAHREYGIGADAKRLGADEEYEYYFSRVENMVVPNIQTLQQVCRRRGIEVMFVRIAALTKDCRDVSPMHKRLNLLAPKGSKEAEILDEIKPLENEVLITKGCSGAFNGSNIDQILGNMGIKNLVVSGVVTNYCVETTVRSAGDRDYNVVLIDDACAAWTQEAHDKSLQVLDEGYCKVMTTNTVIDLIESQSKKPTNVPA